MNYLNKNSHLVQLFSRKIAGLVLSVFGILKLITSVGGERILSQSDPVTGIALWQLLLLAGLVETVAGCWLLFSRRQDALWLITIAGFSTAFITYRFRLNQLGFHGWCPCLGNLGQWWPWLSLHVKTVSNAALGLLLTTLTFGAFSYLIGNEFAQGRVTSRNLVGQLKLILVAAILLAAWQSRADDAVEIKGRTIQMLYLNGTNFATYVSPFTIKKQSPEWSISQDPSPLGEEGFLAKNSYCDGNTLTSLTVFRLPTNVVTAITNRIDIHNESVPEPDLWRTRLLWFALINTNFSNSLIKTNLCYVNSDQDVEYYLKNYSLSGATQPDGSQYWTLASDGSIPIGGSQHLFVAQPFPCLLFELATEKATGTVAKVTQLTMHSAKGPPILCWTLAVVVDSRSIIPSTVDTDFSPPVCYAIVHDYRLMAGNEDVNYLSSGTILGINSPTLQNIRQGLIVGQKFGFHLWSTLIIFALAILPPLVWLGINRMKQKQQKYQ